MALGGVALTTVSNLNPSCLELELGLGLTTMTTLTETPYMYEGYLDNLKNEDGHEKKNYLKECRKPKR